MKTCIVCGVPIVEGRLKAIPNTKVCTEHSNATPYVANIVGIGDPEDDHYQEIEIIRDQRLAKQLDEYKKQLGQYKS